MDRPEDWDAETVEEALVVLQDLVEWELGPQRWEQVGQILERITAALAAQDADDLREAVADLQLSSPSRALRIGSANTGGIPEPVLDRRNTLVYRLSNEHSRRSNEQSRRAATTPEGGRGDQPAR
jgi:hypothetical protein